MNRIVLFGAGEVGKRAIRYFGIKRIAAVIDNNPMLQGTSEMSVPIISFDEYKNANDLIKLDLVLSVSKKYRATIEEMLIKEGFTNYYFFDAYAKKRWTEAAKYIEKYEKVIIFGLPLHDLMVLELSNSFLANRVVALTDFDDSINLGQSIGRYQIVDAHEVKDTSVIFLIQDELFHVAASEYLFQVTGDRNRIDNPYCKISYYGGKLLINPYECANEDSNETLWNATIAKSQMIQAVNKYVQIASRKVPLFRYLEIETINRCNGGCSFCPVNKQIDPRPEHRMTEKLFKKIIDNLADLDYSGEICTFSNNEPFLDERIIELNAYARMKLPNARLHLYTNGTLLTIEKFVLIMQYLDELVIDNYHQDLKMIKPVEEIYQYILNNNDYDGKVSIVLRKPNEILTSRGGDAPNRKDILSFPNDSCALPFEQMVIRPDGKVSLCCNDPLGRNTLGDLNKQSLEEVWYGAPYTRVRELIAQGRKEWKHCANCDTFYLY